MVCHVATHRYPHGRVEPPCRIRRPHQHVASRLPRIDPLKNSGNQLSFASSGSRSRFREGQGQQVPCVGLFTPLGVLRSYVIARVLLLSWDGCCLSLRSCSPFTWLPLPRESAPRLARQAIAPAEASLSLLLRGLCYSRVSRLFCCWSVTTSVCDHARAHSGVEHTSAVSTGTVRDPRDQPSSSPRSTSSRRPFITGSSCSSPSPGVLLLLSARGLTRDQSSLRVPSYPLRSLSASNFFSRLDFSSRRSAKATSIDSILARRNCSVSSSSGESDLSSHSRHSISLGGSVVS